MRAARRSVVDIMSVGGVVDLWRSPRDPDSPFRNHLAAEPMNKLNQQLLEDACERRCRRNVRRAPCAIEVEFTVYRMQRSGCQLVQSDCVVARLLRA